MKKTVLLLTFIVICLGIVFFPNLSDEEKEKPTKTLENTQSVFDTEVDLDTDSNDRTKLVSTSDFSDFNSSYGTIDIKDNYGFSWRLSTSRNGSNVRMTFMGTESYYPILYIPGDGTYYARDLYGGLYKFTLSWTRDFITIDKAVNLFYVDSDFVAAKSDFLTDKTYQISTFSWYPDHPHMGGKTGDPYSAGCTNAELYQIVTCFICGKSGKCGVFEGEALGHDNSLRGQFGIFNYTTCSKDGWTISDDGTFESSKKMTDYDIDADWLFESVITLTFSVSVISNIKFNYLVKMTEKYDEFNANEFTVKIDGSQKLSVTDKKTGSFQFKVNPGSHTMILSYTKKKSIDEGNDLAKISSLIITSAQENGNIVLPEKSGSVQYGTEQTQFDVDYQTGPLSVTTDNQTVVASIQKRSEEEDIYSVSLSNLSTISAGTTITVTVTAAETEFYYSAQETYRLTITKADLSPTVNMNGYTYGGIVSTPSVSGNSGNGSVTYYYTTTNTNSGGTAWSGINSTKLNAGTYYMYAVIDATTNYNGATTPAKAFTISKADLSAQVNLNDFIYGEDVSPSVTGNLGEGKVTYYYSKTNTNNGGTSWTTSKDITVGNYYLYAVIEETINYNGIKTTTQNFKVSPLGITVPTSDEKVFTYNGETQTYLPNGFDSSTMTITGHTRKDAGTQDVLVSLKDTLNYCWKNEETTAEKIYSFTIHPKEVTVTFGGYEDLVYSGREQTISVQLNGLLEADTCNMMIAGNKGTNAGKYTCGVTSIDNANYTLSGETSLEWTIAKYQIDKPTEDATLYTYNGKEQTYQVSASSYYTVSNETQTNAGNYTVVIALNDSNNYEWYGGETADLEYTFAIAKKEVAIVWSEMSFTYNGDEQDQSGIKAYYLRLPDNQKNYLTVSCNEESFKVAGEYIFTVELDDTQNYTIANTTESHRYTIEKAEITIKADNKTSVYKAMLQNLTYQVASGTNYHEEIRPILSTTASESVQVGTYPITIEAENANYIITFQSGEYTITPKQITVDILDQTSRYTGQEPIVNQMAYQTDEIGDLGIVITKNEGVASGRYELTADYTNKNYTITFIYTQKDHSLYIIEEAEYTVLPTDYIGVYDKQEHSGTIQVGLEEGNYTIYYSIDTTLNEENYATGTTVKPVFKNVGRKTVYFYITVDNYKDAAGSYIVEITPKEVTVNFNNYENLVYSGNEQSIIVELVGIINGDSCSMTVTGNKGTNAGKYTCGGNLD